MELQKFLSTVSSFTNVQAFLSNSSQEGVKAREDLALTAAHTKTGAGVVAAFAGMLCVANAISLFISPEVGCTALLAHAAFALVGRDIFIIAGNAVTILSNQSPVDAILANIIGRTSTSLTPQWFVDAVFANTWIAAPLLGATIVQKYQQPARAS